MAPAFANGPDQGGYRWDDSDTVGGPTFGWIDITGSGTRLALGDDDNLGPFWPGFTFPFYGQGRDSVRVCSNGWLSFSSGSHQFHYCPFPDPHDPNAVIAPLWADLDPAAGGAVYYQADTGFGRFIVSWVGVPLHGTQDSCTFQVILDTSGTIRFQYLVVPGSRFGADSCSVGIENDQGLVGLQYVYAGQPQENQLHDSLVIRFYQFYRDACPSAIGRPFGQELAGDSVVPAVIVWNPGKDTVSLPVRLTIGAYEEEVIVAGLGPLQDTLLEFPAWVPGVESCAVELITELPGDEFPGNDTMRTTVIGSSRGELRYDDGTPDTWFLRVGSPTIDWGAAVRFSSSLPECRLLGARVLVADTRPFERVLVCPDDSGAPDLNHPFVAAESVAASGPGTWLEVPADTLLNQAGDIWLVAFWPRRAQGPAIGEDRTLPVDRRSFFGSPSVRWVSYAEGDLCCRLKVEGPTGIAELQKEPSTCGLRLTAWPNPFRTSVSLQLTTRGPVELRIFDASGRCVRTLALYSLLSTPSSLSWDGRDDSGRRVSAGTYFIRVQSGSEARLASVILAR